MLRSLLIVPLTALTLLSGCAAPEVSTAIPNPNYPEGFEKCVADELKRGVVGACIDRAMIDWYQWKRIIEGAD